MWVFGFVQAMGSRFDVRRPAITFYRCAWNCEVSVLIKSGEALARFPATGPDGRGEGPGINVR
jgi:hypothetical protein